MTAKIGNACAELISNKTASGNGQDLLVGERESESDISDEGITFTL